MGKYRTVYVTPPPETLAPVEITLEPSTVTLDASTVSITPAPVTVTLDASTITQISTFVQDRSVHAFTLFLFGHLIFFSFPAVFCIARRQGTVQASYDLAHMEPDAGF